MRKSDGVRVHYKKKSNEVRVDHEKKSDWVSVRIRKRSIGVRVDHEKDRWGKSSPIERAMG